jgi:hypothetical protein
LIVAYKIEVESVVARLMAAFPTFRMPRPTVDLWIQKLAHANDLDMRDAAEQFIERGTKFPTISDMLTRTRDIASARTKAEDTKEHFWIDAGAPSNMTSEERRAVHAANFEKGRRNAQEHMDRMLSDRNLEDCPCLSCVQRRESRSTVGAS